MDGTKPLTCRPGMDLSAVATSLRSLPGRATSAGIFEKNYRVTPEVKELIIKHIKEGGVPVAQAAKEHGIHEITAYGELGPSAERAPSAVEVAKLKRENQALLEFVSN